NLRELQNVLQRMIIFSEKEFLSISDLPPEIQNYNKITQTEKKKTGTDLKAEMTKINEDLSMRELEKEAILKALKKAENNKDLAARILGISRASIYRKLKEYRIKN
ncbi:MAG TPA: helix-turn-helix domain-containing protein, partial [Leptospiraceae bacterium]|nr:helix-turn-helix domain-containing protein [Leptospiraceae bacterium]